MMPMSYFDGKDEKITIKVPKYSVYSDYDYIGFTYNGKHACEDLGIYRVSSSKRYQEELNPQRREQSAEAPSADYVYYLRETFGPRKFKVDFAFEGLSQTRINAIRDCFDDKDIHELWFDEYPYKVYEAKVQGPVTLKVIPFGASNEEPTYSGEGSVTFVCYTPYARTSDWVEKQDGTREDGRNIDAYKDFTNMKQWKDASRLQNTNYSFGRNFGDIPAPFVFQKDFTAKDNEDIDVKGLKIGDAEISFELIGELDTNGNPTNTPQLRNYKWNSTTGLIYCFYQKKDQSAEKWNLIKLEPLSKDTAAKSTGTLPVSTTNSNVDLETIVSWTQSTYKYKMDASGATYIYNESEGKWDSHPMNIILKYHYWYY